MLLGGWHWSKRLLRPHEVGGVSCALRGMIRGDGIPVVRVLLESKRAEIMMDMPLDSARELADFLLTSAKEVETRQMQLKIEAEGGM